MKTLAKRGKLTGNTGALTPVPASTEVAVNTLPGSDSNKGPIDFWTDPFFNQHARKAIKVYAAQQMQAMQARMMSRVSACDSPLEAAFIAWWMVMVEPFSSLEMVSQHNVTARGRRYRLDIYCRPLRDGRYAGLLGLEDAPKVAIELDGHSFHERTTTQVTKANRRDRDLIADGWTMLHVSGSEFHADALGTVINVCEDADAVYQSVMRTRLLRA